MNGERQPPIFILTGLILGVALGLVYAWVLTPPEMIETTPLTLMDDFKDDYRALIASAYIASGDLDRAKARLELLGDDDPARSLAVQAQLTLGEGGSQDVARALGILSAHLEGNLDGITLADAPTRDAPPANTPGEGTANPPTAAPVTSTPTAPADQTPQDGTPGPTSETPESTQGPTPTPTIRPSATPTATRGAAFDLIDIQLVCDPNIPAPLVQVYVFDAANKPVPGVQAVIIWDGGQDSFFTGFKPEFGLGYADFEMTPEVSYTLRLTDGSEPVTALLARECEDDGGQRYWGSWRLNFTQP